MTMTQTELLDGSALRELLASGYANLCAHEQVVNDLNVFPIPDGDTGSNMRLTLEGGVQALTEDGAGTVGEAAQRIADGVLLTARGNSGVILSQLIAGVAAVLAGHQQADSRLLAQAALAGVDTAYKAVITPVEGTLLTVARESAQALSEKLEQRDMATEEFFSVLLEEMRKSLMKTPELLPVLKEAGVIDSGGAGLVYIVEGMELALGGKPVEMDLHAGREAASGASRADALDLSGFDENSVLDLGYCTEFLLRLQNAKTDIPHFDVDALIGELHPLGESIVAFQNGSIVKVHIHTKTPGAVFELCQRYGEFLTVKVENMNLQHSSATVENRYEAPKQQKKKPFGVVAVANGKGMCEVFSQFGADAIVQGGQTMNPSPLDFLDAFRTVNAETIIVMPNNRNIIPAALQAASLYRDADVRVLETETLGEGYQALTMLDFTSGDADAVMGDLQEVISAVTTAAVSRAVRDASVGGVQVHDGEYLGLVGKTVLATGNDRVEAACRLLDALDTDETEVLVVWIGAVATAQDALRVREYVKQKMPRVELYELDGGQAIYDFLFVL